MTLGEFRTGVLENDCGLIKLIRPSEWSMSNLISPDARSSSNRVTFSLRRNFHPRGRVRLTTGGRDVIKMYFGLCAGGGARHSGIAFSSRVLHLLTITALPNTLLTRMLNASRFWLCLYFRSVYLIVTQFKYMTFGFSSRLVQCKCSENAAVSHGLSQYLFLSRTAASWTKPDNRDLLHASCGNITLRPDG